MKTLALAGLIFALCFAPVAAQVPPEAFGPLFATTGNSSGSPSPGWSIFPCGPVSTNCGVSGGGGLTLQTGTSLGPNNLWLITVTMYMSTGVASAGNSLSMCARSNSPITVLDATTAGVNTCTSVPSGNPIFMGGPGFASSAAQGNYSQKLLGHLSIASNATFNMTCLLGSQAATAIILSGYCSAEAQMY